MTSNVQLHTITEANEGQRLDNFLLGHLKGVPKSMIYRIIRKGEVRVNKGRAKPERKLVLGDIVRIPPVREAEGKVPVKASSGLRQLLTDSILYEDKALMVVNKPSGLAVHGGSGISLGLIESLRQMVPENSFLELVHRLDRDTSGCVLVAKKRSMLVYLQDLFRGEKKIDKRYMALVKGRWPNRGKVVDAPLQKNELQSGERVVRVSLEGKASKTEFEVVQRFEESTLIEARPITGRTHQIRVHALHKGHPLVGDEKYGDEDFNRQMKSAGSKRLFLHAASLSFPLPEGAGRLQVKAPLPSELQTVLNNLE
ncbi:23S rRNA pseudouridine(955/2504/2580) synthase RluC [Teredinibacter purpureus]|jgi:ribosomal large subunit pseudouridine synthase C (EC 5.4.99.-)|uniref:23S rRNA pseudouridine(955/2504/2580) synthase RluC n=1 Tax=Teredinibacter purpureus TaxID=2731756 RepID=UPI0005F7FA64|nr:23S rRNA pseudouridine(955/2504/2580) synthase RluC [Teredinibacter purpureus]